MAFGFSKKNAGRIADVVERIERGPINKVRRTPTAIGVGTSKKILRVVSVQDDYITCVFSDDLDGATVKVAKPYKLRKTPFDGKTVGSYTYAYSGPINRVSTMTGGDEETQTVVPSYTLKSGIYDGDEIIAEQINSSKLDGTFTKVSLLDTNRDARAWAKVGV